MEPISCPKCGGTGLRIDPSVSPGADRSLWVVGDLNGRMVLSEEEWPEDDSIVWLVTEPGNPMTLDEFDRAQGEGVVGWLAEPEAYEPQ